MTARGSGCGAAASRLQHHHHVQHCVPPPPPSPLSLSLSLLRAVAVGQSHTSVPHSIPFHYGRLREKQAAAAAAHRRRSALLLRLSRPTAPLAAWGVRDCASLIRRPLHARPIIPLASGLPFPCSFPSISSLSLLSLSLYSNLMTSQFQATATAIAIAADICLPACLPLYIYK